MYIQIYLEKIRMLLYDVFYTLIWNNVFKISADKNDRVEKFGTFIFIY